MDFLLNGMNIIDVLAILPYYVSLLLEPRGEGEEAGSLDEILQVFRIFKLARIFKLGRHSPGLQSVIYTIRQSVSILIMLLYMN